MKKSDPLEGDVDLLICLIVLGFRLVVTLFGLVGNLLSFIVWSRPQLKSSSSVVLAVLAICDTLVILCALWYDAPLVYNTLKMYNGDRTFDPTIANFIHNYYTQWSLLVSGKIYNMAVTASVHLTVIITVEKYILICHPFRFKEWCSYGRTCKFVAITIIFSVVYHMSRFWESERIRKIFLAEEKNITFQIITHDLLYAEFYRSWMFIFIDYLLPLTCIITLNTITYIKLKRTNMKRRAMTDSQKNEIKLTTMVLYVVIEFLVFTSFSGFISMIRIFPYIFVNFYSHHSFLLWRVRDFLNSLNSSVNFVTYVSSWPPFRKTFTRMFCCHKKGNQTYRQVPGILISK